MTVKFLQFLARTAFCAILFFYAAALTYAHSTVTPSETATSKYETFNLSVPTERDVPTTAVRLRVPESLDRVTPFVKPGWEISITKGEDDQVTDIEWTGGSIPAGQKDVFPFTARTPQEDTTLIWKVYQIYQDGEIVAWDQDPEGRKEDAPGESSNPYSKTDVAADAAVQAGSDTAENGKNNGTDRLPYMLSLAALGVSLAALIIARQRHA